MKRKFSVSTIVSFLLAFLVLDVNVSWSKVDPSCTKTGEFKVCFTVPGAGIVTIEDELIRVIDDAKSTIDIAIYEFNLHDVADALIRADARGVRVRMVTESENMEKKGSVIPSLKNAGIPVVGDNRNYYMHNKFMVVDGKTVWTGSYNWTENGTKLNNNNAVVIESVELARIFTGQFEKMFAGDFSHRDNGDTLYKVKLPDSEVDVCFAPESSCYVFIVQELEKAKKSIKFMAFSFTDNVISDELIELQEKGIEVSGVFEQLGSSSPSRGYSRMFSLKLDNTY